MSRKISKQLWTYEAGEASRSNLPWRSLAVRFSSARKKAMLVALSLDNGSVYWKFTTGNPIGEFFPGVRERRGLHR